MTAHDEQANLRGIKDPGDAWVVTSDGQRYWGKFGAAGLLAYDPARGVLMQHRVEWSDHGNTWGVPGGAINQGEDAIAGAIREAQEEAGVPDNAVTPTFTHVIKREEWSYTTVIANVTKPFEPEITDPESLALAWVPIYEVTDLQLHPGFAASWPVLLRLLLHESNPSAIVKELQDLGHSVELA